MFIFSLSRVLFFWFNRDFFPDVGLDVFFYGLRFDFSAILAFNFLYVLLFIFFGYFEEKKWTFHIKRTVYVFFNFIGVSYNCVDFGYFPFVLKRSTADGFNYLSSTSDFWLLIPQFIKDFWFVFVFGIAFNWLYFIIYNYLEKENIGLKPLVWWKHSLIGLLILAISIIGIRGGLQLKPINVITANTHVDEKYTPLVLNTAFTIMKTLFSDNLEEKKFYSQEELENLYPTSKNYFQNETLSKDFNVVMLVMESFSYEYIGALSGEKSYTPFLDSLIEKSVVFENAFANGKRSVEGLPSILSGIPHLMERPYISSPYATNKTTSIAHLLKKKNYSTSFFHGGTNGTMGFDAFCASAGIEKYYGLNEYLNKKEDYDGNWGIFDEPYFQYFAEKLNEFSNPFFSVFFSLSSHHPYTIPNHLQGKFDQGEIPILESVMYADYSLKKFFETIEKSDFYDNTLFIITADHTGPRNKSEYGNKVGMYRVPIIFHQKNILPQRISTITQHIDILPTLMDYLNYPHSFFSFGNSAFSDNENFAINYFNEIYQLKQSGYLLQFDGTKSIALYDIEKDIYLTNNLINDLPEKVQKLETKTKAIIQKYQHKMINNKMYLN